MNSRNKQSESSSSTGRGGLGNSSYPLGTGVVTRSCRLDRSRVGRPPRTTGPCLSRRSSDRGDRALREVVLNHSKRALRGRHRGAASARTSTPRKPAIEPAQPTRKDGGVVVKNQVVGSRSHGGPAVNSSSRGRSGLAARLLSASSRDSRHRRAPRCPATGASRPARLSATRVIHANAFKR